MRITDAKMTKRRKVSIYLDEEFAFTVLPRTWSESGLRVGMEVDDEALNELIANSKLDEGKKQALDLLSRKSYTTKQLETKLSQKVGQEAAQSAIERMSDLGLVNDEDYAHQYVMELFRYKLYGRKRIAQKLYERGIPKAIAEDALAELDAAEERDNALVLLDKKLFKGGAAVNRDKAYAILQRYGYTSDVISRALSQLEFLENEDETICLSEWE